MGVKVADKFVAMGDFELLDAQDVLVDIGGTPKRLQEAIDNGELGGTGTSVTVDTEMSDTSENPIQNKVIKKYVDDNLTDVQTELADVKKELGDGMTLVADAITAKGVETATDATLEVMAENIGAIKIGDDTSDATATAIDIMAGKTAWVKGNKITGIATSSELHGATISVSSVDDVLVGKDIVLSKDGTVVGSRTLDENLVCSFAGIQEVGEYVISASVGDLSNEKSVTITSDNVINKTVVAVTFSIGSLFSKWVRLGRITQTFSTLDEVFADEVTVRQLMTVHDSVDFLKRWMLSEPEIIDTFVANATAMKWMGLRDYVYDTLTSGVDGLEEKILASDNWEYALKDHVPVMTSNTAPYGEVSAISQLNTTYPSYAAFNYDDSSSWWHSALAGAPGWLWIGYNFINPIRVNRLKFRVAGGRPMTQIEVQGSFDGENWDSIYSETNVYGSTTANDTKEYIINFSNDEYYKYYRLRGYIEAYVSGGYAMAVALQFYGRSLNVSVPKMTSNTAPYGEAFTNSITTGYDAYKAFNGVSASHLTDRWASGKNALTTSNVVIGYKFTYPVCVKRLMVKTRCDNQTDGTVDGTQDYPLVLEGSNDGQSWDIIQDISMKADDSYVNVYTQINNTGYYTYYRCRFTVANSLVGSDTWCNIAELQFYGVDYSEREFAEGSTMSYIYDHGIIFNDFIGGLSYVKYTNPSESLFEDTYAKVGTNTILQTDNMVDLSKYSILYIKSVLYNPIATNSYLNIHCILNVKLSTWGQTGDSSIWEGYLAATAQDECGPTVRCLDVSSITKMCTLAMQCGQSATTEFTEWWLE